MTNGSRYLIGFYNIPARILIYYESILHGCPMQLHYRWKQHLAMNKRRTGMSQLLRKSWRKIGRKGTCRYCTKE